MWPSIGMQGEICHIAWSIQPLKLKCALTIRKTMLQMAKINHFIEVLEYAINN
jgi:hypothetical protein